MNKILTHPMPISLETLSVPEFPADIIPGFLGDQAKAVAEHTETPIEMAVLLGLTAVSTATQGKYEAQIKRGYREPINLYAATVLPSGNRKTAVLKEMAAPLETWESSKGRQISKDIAAAEATRQTTQCRIQALRSRLRKESSEDFENIEKEIEHLHASMPRVPMVPRVFTQDVTPEKLAELMAENDEKMAIFSDEGGIFDIMGGRYSRGIPNLDIFLQAHAGSNVRVDRLSRSPLSLKRALLTMALTPQPQVLEGLSHSPEFRGRGLLARFIYTCPPSPLGFRTFSASPIPKGVTTRYAKGIEALLNKKRPTMPDGTPGSYIIRLSPAAYDEWLDFALRVETEMQPGEILSHITDWAGKLPGTAARIAALFHCVEHAHGQPSLAMVPASTMKQALALAAVLRSHALAVFDLLGADPSIRAARKILTWIYDKQRKRFTARECFQDLKGYFDRMTNLQPGFDALQERHYIFRVPGNAEKGPGRPSTRFLVNPTLTEEWT